MRNIVIPEDVRFDQSMPYLAALIYGELMLLCRTGGGKTAVRDKDLAELYGRDVRTVGKYVCLLCKRGYFTCERVGIRRYLKPNGVRERRKRRAKQNH